MESQKVSPEPHIRLYDLEQDQPIYSMEEVLRFVSLKNVLEKRGQFDKKKIREAQR